MSNENQKRRYWAFISYSHLDKDWADWLHNKLETYKVPTKLVGKPNRSGTVPKRLYPIFRDREELPTSANLGAIIENALSCSEYLIVICSPRAAASRWVNEEILSFKAMGKADRVLALIVEGEPNATGKPGIQDKECFPEALRYDVDENGALSDIPAEPVAGDARPVGDGKRNALLKLLAGVLGVDYAMLNDREHKRRLQRSLISATAFFLLVAAGLTIWGVQEQRRLSHLRVEHAKTVEQRNRALKNLAAIHLEEGRQALAKKQNAPALLRMQASLQSFDTLGARLGTAMALRYFTPELASFPAHKGKVHALAVTPDGVLVSSGMGDTVSALTLDGLKQTAAFDSVPWAYALAATQDGDILAAAMDGVHRLSPKDGSDTLLEDTSCPGCMYAFSGDGGRVASLDAAKGEVRVSDVSGEQLATVTGLQQPTGIMAFSDDSAYLALGEGAGSVLVWDVAADAAKARFTGLSGQVSALAFSPDARYLAAGEGQFLGGPGEVLVLVWDTTQTPQSPPVAKLKGHEQQINHLAFSADGRLLASNSQADKTLRLWDASRFNPVLFENPLFVYQPLAAIPQPRQVSALRFTPRGLLLTGDMDGALHLLDVRGLGTEAPATEGGFTLSAAAAAADRIALLRPGGVVDVLNPKDAELVASVEATPGSMGISAMALSADGRLLARVEKLTVIVHALDGSTPDVLFETDAPVQAMVFAPDASAIALAGQGTMRVHTLPGGAVSAMWNTAPEKLSNTPGVAFSPQGRYVALASNYGPLVIDAQSGEQQDVPGYSDAVQAVAFAPATDGAPPMLLAGCLDGLLRRWSVGDWRGLEPLRGHELLIAALSASADGAFYATAAGNELRFWQTPQGELLLSVRTNLIGLDSLLLPGNGTYAAWTSDMLDILEGATLPRGELAALLDRLGLFLELGFPFAMDVNGELASRAPGALGELRLKAAREGLYPWALEEAGLSETTLARAAELAASQQQ